MKRMKLYYNYIISGIIYFVRADNREFPSSRICTYVSETVIKRQCDVFQFFKYTILRNSQACPWVTSVIEVRSCWFFP